MDASHPAPCAFALPVGSPPCSGSETLVKLLAAATATFDSDRDTAKACIVRAAELAQVSQIRDRHRSNESSALRGGLAPWQAKRAAAYIEENFTASVRVADLAGIVQLSVSHFSRAFRRSFGEPPHTYIMRQRMRRAQAIILSSREPLARIALDCGMSDQAHFSRVFRKIVGTSPGTWRRLFPPPAPSAAHRIAVPPINRNIEPETSNPSRDRQPSQPDNFAGHV